MNNKQVSVMNEITYKNTAIVSSVYVNVLFKMHVTAPRASSTINENTNALCSRL